VSGEPSRRGSSLVLEGITKSYGTSVAVSDVSLVVEPREFVTLLGPSGSGKTTILRMIGGFLSPDSGRIVIDGSDVAGVPVERRPTAMLFQQLSLWPHLSVARNVSFGLELRRVPRREITARVSELLAVVGLADFGDRLPGQLSGGQQQRVALARALALEPRILLLDEPFSALDTKLRVELRTFVRNLQREVGTTTLLVTHDQEEALELSDRIVVLRDGCVEQVGTPTEIYDAPATGFVAEFLGAMNFLSARLAGQLVVLDGGASLEVVEPLPAPARGTGAASPSAATPSAANPVVANPVVGVRPEDVLVEPDAGGDILVEQVVLKGHYNEVTLAVGGAVLRAYVGKEVGVCEGSSVAVRLRRVRLFPAGATGAARSPAGAVLPAVPGGASAAEPGLAGTSAGPEGAFSARRVRP